MQSPSLSEAPSSLSLDEQDESVRIAVRALGAMRNSSGKSQPQSPNANSMTSYQPTPALSITSSSTSTSLPSPSPSIQEDVNSPDFVSRVSHLPLVNTALRAYEHGKASSRVVKYGAEMVESSVKTISRPVIDRLPVNVNQLDEFACRQLDRIGRYRRPSEADIGHLQDDGRARSRERGRRSLAEDDTWSSGLQTRDSSMSGSYNRNGKIKQVSSWSAAASSPSSQSRQPLASEEMQSDSSASSAADNSAGAAEHDQVAQRSRWQAVLLEAGGISAAVSEESMRRLKYCLQWLQYATAHIDAQILVLRDFTASLQSSTSNPSALISPQHMRTLADVRRDVVHTIRQVVDVVSKYAGGALPEPARSRVRGFILHLPQRWASAAQGEGVAKGAGCGAAVGGVPVGNGGTRRRYQHHRERGNGSGVERSLPDTPASSRPGSPVTSPRLLPRRELQANGHGHGHAAVANGVPPTAGSATQAAQRILTLSTESLDMMRGVTAVVKESLDRAEGWVERLRVVGLQRQQQQPESHAEQWPRDSSGPGDASANEANHSSSSSPSSSGMARNGLPPSGVVHGLGGLTIASIKNENGGESTSVTPKNGTKSLPEVETEEQQPVEKVKNRIAGDSTTSSGDISDSGPMKDDGDFPAPEISKMDVDV